MVQNNQDLKRADVWFICHGVRIGPPTMFDFEGEGYKSWVKMGESVRASNPKGIVIVSAHWESDYTSDQGIVVSINSELDNPLIYDFYNFPKHFYEERFCSQSDPAIRKAVKDALTSEGVLIKEEKRGIDHGVWPPLKVVLGEKTTVPILQVSLPGDSSPVSTAKVGKALSAIRDQGYTVIGSGQTVHNLRDYFSGRPTPYTEPFLAAASAAVHSSDPVGQSIGLTKHPLYRSAHPTDEHFLPLVFAVAAADPGDKQHGRDKDTFALHL
ncbi:Extradiol ring-cleavage dioxygenase, class III enzyme, subunit B [Kockovaella imperatae]|uniref:Extradiol ring-cleavage dioxygenase, class III enzyme, subunit B n=1 Tax=Kockovaella imperatae TaxID=4999 RepID=A0A1Y1UTT3_9TREE|nr:Extradiol ring-cleavage dioxygenase, class III enzyme, subunit B [Kockovaella imperatae]ORX40605.1 Extradiol ring-cleavage dioxygenase, class III enzyme, subunit B [Kockovaella imperatae]